MSRLFINTCYQTLLKTNCTSKKITTCRLLHLKCRFRNTYLKPCLVPKFSRHTSVFGAVVARCASTDETSTVPTLLDQIPEAPVPIPVSEVLETIVAVGEPSFKSLGLGGYSPVGLIQQCLEWLHVGCGVPWWGTIVIGTICVRTLMFPLVILSQRNSAKLNNHLPEMQYIQLKISEARRMGNHFDCAKYSEDLLKFLKKYDISIFKNVLVPLVQAPVFCSFFMALRSMANIPVQSLQQGGLWWFTDLTVCDPYYILPIITSLTLCVTIEVGTDSAKLQSMGIMRHVLRFVPLAIIPFTINFPGAILCYWVSTNFISLIQVGIIRIPKVREYFNIEPLIVFNPKDLPKVNKGFVAGFKESWSNVKIAREFSERERVDEMEFFRAGRGPLRKTFKFNPLDNASSSNSMMTKRR